MIVLNKIEEELLNIIKNKYEELGNSYDVYINDFPQYILPNIDSISSELKRAGYISYISIDDNCNAMYKITPYLLSYYDDKAKLEAEKQRSSGNTYYVDSITADGSNLVLGNVMHSSLNIDNSIKKIYDEIESDGGEEKEKLRALMIEVESIINEIKSRGVVPKKVGLKERISNHLEKHGWFYSRVISLIGTAALQFVG